ncbi:MAG: hypothetical protein KY476_20585, partial [Planctomycetes bacterium]|nr:hypothetical protein [Planctomycetota bacterium]
LMALGLRLGHRLMPAAAYTLYFQWAAMLLAAGWTVRRSSPFSRDLLEERGRSERGTRALLWRVAAKRPALWAGSTAYLAAAALWSGLVCGFHLLIDGALLVNAHVAALWLLMPARCLLAGLFAIPSGLIVGTTACGQSSGEPENDRTPRLRPGGVLAFALGFLAAHLAAQQLADAAGIAAALVWTLVAFAVWENLRSAKSREWTRHRAVFAALVAILIAAGPLLRPHDAAARAGRLLFSTNVFLAKQAGLSRQLLGVLDEGRLTLQREGAHGTLTVWRFRGTQHQIRESGMPRAIVSANPKCCPHYSAEVMPAVLPLVLHESPRKVLLLGLGGGVSLTTTLNFPVLEVTCLEGDAALPALLKDHVWPDAKLRPLEDDRLRLVIANPAWALGCRGEPVDVIVSCPGASSQLSAAAEFTPGFYERAAERLTADGIFCQRFGAVDYGPAPLQTAAATLRRAFCETALVEIAAGEYALLATNSPKGLVREGVVERLQAPHVRRTLAQVGWDWSMPLNIPVWSHEALSKLATGRPGANTPGSGRFAFRLPQEVMRWAPKTEEVAAVLGPHAGRFLEWKGIDGNDPELLRRLAEVTGQRRLMTEKPDQFWAYRKSVKEQITERPQSQIVQVKGEVRQARHPGDRRRMAYFAALADAVTSRDVTAAQIAAVDDYAQPYDPLVSYFLHQEVAELWARSAERDVTAELEHRLHAIYFSAPEDRSVRNVAEAIELLVEHPEAADDEVQRWDHLNALVQMLKLRWEVRSGSQPKSSRIALNDIDRSLDALEEAMAALDELHAAQAVAETNWPERRRYLERALVRPLRTYRSRLVPYHLKHRREALADGSAGHDAEPPAVE